METAVLGPWKEIAVYLNRGVRTTQRWESNKNLPIHRVDVGDKAPVFAFLAEIQDWLRAQPIQVDVALVELPSRHYECV